MPMYTDYRVTERALLRMKQGPISVACASGGGLQRCPF